MSDHVGAALPLGRTPALTSRAVGVDTAAPAAENGAAASAHLLERAVKP